MKLRNTRRLSARGLQQEVDRGARFVYYPYTISFFLYITNKKSPVYMIRPGDKNTVKRTWYCLISALLGWWGIPKGPKQTIQCIRTNMNGGKDVTDDIMATVEGHILYQETQKQQKAGAV